MNRLEKHSVHIDRNDESIREMVIALKKFIHGAVDGLDAGAVLLARRAAHEAADAAEAGDTLHARRVGVSLNGATPNGGWRVV